MASSNSQVVRADSRDAPVAIPTPVAVPPSAPSVISTNIASEDCDEYLPEGLATRQSSMRRTNDPERPPSSMSRPSTRATPSRRGTPFSGVSATSAGWRSGAAFGGPGGSISNTSRPQSANSRTSRTHVPSLAAQAFFRPMSSQRLQAQRNNRPAVLQQPPSSADGLSEAGNSLRRHSLGSSATSQRGPTEPLDVTHDILPPSRGTEFTEQEDLFTTNVTPTGNATAQSIGESERPLQRKTSDLRPKHLNISKNYKQGSGALQPIEKSPRSFRANFLLPAGNDARDRRWLRSSTASPSNSQSQPTKDIPAKPVATDQDITDRPLSCFSPVRKSRPSPSTAKSAAFAKPGVNYQHFSGNTVFCWGGRLQNTRDRPINIATSIIVILPSILFFIFS